MQRDGEPGVGPGYEDAPTIEADPTTSRVPTPARGGRPDGLVIGRALALVSVAVVVLLVAAATAWGSVNAQQLARAENVIRGLRTSVQPSAAPRQSDAPAAPTARPSGSVAPAPAGPSEADIQARVDAAVAAERASIATTCLTPMTAVAQSQSDLLKSYDRVASVYQPGSRLDKDQANQVQNLKDAYSLMAKAADSYQSQISLAKQGNLGASSATNGSENSAKGQWSQAVSDGKRVAADEGKVSSKDWKALDLAKSTAAFAAAKTACAALASPAPSVAP